MKTVHISAGTGKCLCTPTPSAIDYASTSLVERCTCEACLIALDVLLSLGFKPQRRWRLLNVIYNHKPQAVTFFTGEMRTLGSSGRSSPRWSPWRKFILQKHVAPRGDAFTELRNVEKRHEEPRRVQHVSPASVRGFLMARNLHLNDLQRSAA